MPHIRLLTSAAGNGPVAGVAGDVLKVDAETARVWADGVRAELVRDETRSTAVPPRPERTTPERRRRRA